MESTAVERADTDAPSTVPAIHSEAEFARVVDSLARELEGLRSSARLRAVIEQAKGILVVQHHISLDEAFDRLRDMSQEHNVRLVEVAATVVGANLPPGADLGLDLATELSSSVDLERTSPSTSAAWRTLRTEADLQMAKAQAVFHAMTGAAREPQEAGRLLHALTAPIGVEAVALYRLVPDGSLRLVAWHGFPSDWMKGWQAIPPGVDVPLMRCVVQRRTIALRSLAERAERFPALLTRRTAGEATVNVPVLDGDEVTGSAIFAWPAPRQFDDATIRRAEQVAQTAGPILVRHDMAADPDLLWLQAMLEMLFDPWLLLEPVRDDGVLAGFRVVGVSGLVPDAAAAVGRRLLELWPLLTLGVLERLFRVHSMGSPWVDTLAADELDGLPLIGPQTEVRAVRLGERIVLLWRSL